MNTANTGLSLSWWPQRTIFVWGFFLVLLRLWQPCENGDSVYGATIVRLKNGLQLEGGIVEFASINADPFSAGQRGEVEVRPIWMIDDGLRRVYVHQRGMVQSHQPSDGIADTTLKFWQPVADGGNNVSGAGAILKLSPFNSFGRRLMMVQGNHKPLSMLQGVTELTPQYARVESLKGNTNFVWDMRLATSAIPVDELRNMLHEQLQDATDIQQRLELVRFFLQAEMYGEAIREMDAVIAIEPGTEGLKTQRRAIVQQQVGQILDEAILRAASGQKQLAMAMLKNFPEQGVAEETKIRVEQQIERIRSDEQLASTLLKRLHEQLAQLGGDARQQLEPLYQEIARDLTSEGVYRLDDYQRLGDDPTTPLENRIALGLGGWILGSGAGIQNLGLVRSLIEVRRLTQDYLRETNAARRLAILTQLRAGEGATPFYVAKILPQMPPIFAAEVDTWPDDDNPVVGFYDRSLQSGDQTVRYQIQLPPEYDSRRRYPVIVALPPLGGQLKMEIEWWAGRYDPNLKMRAGQATRHGFIVICPEWHIGTSGQYEYTSREHQRVLASLRDAQRHFSIESDRVFIAGHGEGASAAWDIAGAHPDLWAGLVVIGGESRKYVKLYSGNLKPIPMYFVMGEIAGAPNPMVRNGDTLDRYMKPSFECVVVSYRGRGEDHFYEEIHHLFEWFQFRSQRRKRMPQDISATVLRRGDEWFWWMELLELNEKVAINPLLWDYTKLTSVKEVTASVNNGNTIRITSAPATKVAVYLSPEIGIDLQQRVSVSWGGKRAASEPGGNLEVMLEDVRTRADPQHPFWDRLILP